MKPEEAEVQLRKIAGNGSRAEKYAAVKWMWLFNRHLDSFAAPIGRRTQITEVSVLRKAEEPEKLEGRVVCELVVERDMLNGGERLHGGCSMFLIDICSTLPLSVLREHQSAANNAGGVSQSINTIFHSPADLGDKLRIVSTTMALGGRIMSSACEIWNVTHHRLVASGVQLKMHPSPSGGNDEPPERLSRL